MKQAIFVTVVSFCMLVLEVEGHARFVDPVSRATMFRYGYNTHINYNDNELFCGGFNTQHYSNGGKCGICGDDYALPQPRPYEAGGPYATGTIVKTYTQGSQVTLTTQITAQHKGHLEFRICAAPEDKNTEVTQECLDSNRLLVVETNEPNYYLTGSTPGLFPVLVQLPANLTCSHCVIQSTYIAGNSWGICDDGTGAVGCGTVQETFRGCSDVAIVPAA